MFFTPLGYRYQNSSDCKDENMWCCAAACIALWLGVHNHKTRALSCTFRNNGNFGTDLGKEQTLEGFA